MPHTERIRKQDISNPAKILRGYMQATGISDAKELAETFDIPLRTIQRLKLECAINGVAESANDAKRAISGVPDAPIAPDMAFSEPSLALAHDARIETPSGLLSTSEVKQELSEPSVSDHAEKPTPKARRRFSYTAEFQAFWSAYPVTGNSSKSEAFREWRLLLPAEQMLATDGLRHLTEHCRKNPTYTCLHACRYLSQRRWESYETPAQRLAAKPKPAEPDHLKWERIYAEVEAINAM